ncbi:type I-F CRISPR-associated protein Csy2 [Endozoicomonas sp. G2_1]|uniref:type I-F CRISPR-associated protein Csy2 n=1 Tax=Endozoicomonas sp. G2_1 TaxID=2821091 RepID=UPI001ADAAFE1|nr:type I-F CRISPR-associated protein Csy2 [Endozoicomonas sp. G2_1]MBO9489121.1 type I-F CRISPR-associated protein Csy2 [Endozoicomonas sp. G2_1]
MSADFKDILLIPHIQIQNANALSSPFTIGFPAMTAWLGVTHALQRKLQAKGLDITFSGTGVISHDFELQTHRGDNDFVASIVGMANPLDKTGARAAFIEEARCHLEVSLVVEYQCADDQKAELIDAVTHLLHGKMKIAGGDIHHFNSPEVFVVEHEDPTEVRKFMRKAMPGYALIERRDLMLAGMNENLDAMSALLDYLAVHHQSEVDEEGDVTWSAKRKTFEDKPIGWVVPIATGFHGISELGQAKNQRDANTPHRFAESLVTLGEFKLAHHFKRLDDILWRYHFDSENNFYLCQQKQYQQLATPISYEQSPIDEFS